jgi:hypothetical protein
VSPFEESVLIELHALLRAGVPVRAVRLTIHELVIGRIERVPLGAPEMSETVAATMRAAFRLVRETDTPDDLVVTVGLAALDAVRGHGGETARWLAEATATVHAMLDDLVRGRGEGSAWPWLAPRSGRG